MHKETKISLDCPYCNESIFAAVSWFEKSYSTCPNCEKGLAAGQFSATITELEQAMGESIEELLHGKPHGGCCGKKSSCCGDSDS